MRARHLVIALALITSPALANEPQPQSRPSGCSSFTWDVSREVALLQATPTAVAAGDGTSVTRIEPGIAHLATLHPQAQVTLAARPGKPMLDDDAMAGLLTFRVPTSGHYRIAITTSHWIDVVDAGQIIASLDFQGRQGCPQIRKIVEFDLPAGRDLVLQFAGGSAAESGVLITPVAIATE